jgi:hypothetical protein
VASTCERDRHAIEFFAIVHTYWLAAKRMEDGMDRTAGGGPPPPSGARATARRGPRATARRGPRLVLHPFRCMSSYRKSATLSLFKDSCPKLSSLYLYPRHLFRHHAGRYMTLRAACSYTSAPDRRRADTCMSRVTGARKWTRTAPGEPASVRNFALHARGSRRTKPALLTSQSEATF